MCFNPLKSRKNFLLDHQEARENFDAQHAGLFDAMMLRYMERGNSIRFHSADLMEDAFIGNRGTFRNRLEDFEKWGVIEIIERSNHKDARWKVVFTCSFLNTYCTDAEQMLNRCCTDAEQMASNAPATHVHAPAVEVFSSSDLAKSQAKSQAKAAGEPFIYMGEARWGYAEVMAWLKPNGETRELWAMHCGKVGLSLTDGVKEFLRRKLGWRCRSDAGLKYVFPEVIGDVQGDEHRARATSATLIAGTSRRNIPASSYI